MQVEIEGPDNHAEDFSGDYKRHDFMSTVFNHPELKALCRSGVPSVRDKLIAMIAGQVKQDEVYHRKRQAMPGKVANLAFFARMFGNSTPQVISVNTGAPPPLDKPKTFLDRLDTAALLPILASLMLAAAAWKTGETLSWKSASDAAQQTVSVIQKRLDISDKEKSELQSKNDDLQSDMRDLLKQANADSKTDIKTLSDNITKVLTKYKPPPSHQNTTTQTATTGANGN